MCTTLTPGKLDINGYLKERLREVMYDPCNLVQSYPDPCPLFSDEIFMIEIESLYKTYRMQASPPITAVHNLSLVIPDGQIVGLLGAHGAGKTTTIKLIGGLTRPTAGHIRLRGYDVVREQEAALRQVGVLLEDRPALQRQWSVQANLRKAGRELGLPVDRLAARIEQILHTCNLWEHRHAIIATLATSQQRLVALASVILADPPIILLDEPTRGVDVGDAHEVIAVIRQLIQGKTVRLTTKCLVIAANYVIGSRCSATVV